MQSFDAIIVGGGMVGTALACALANTTLNVALIEPHPTTAQPQPEVKAVADVDSRVSALNRASQQFLEHIHAWSSIPDNRKSAYDKMRVWEGTGTGHIQFDAMELGEPYLGHIIENRCTAAALLHAFQQSSNLHLISGVTVLNVERGAAFARQAEENAAQEWAVELSDGRYLYAPLLVGADGARSKIREACQFETREWDYEHHGLVCTVQTEKPHQQAAWQRFTEDGVLAFLPLPSDEPGRHFCSIVWSCPPEQAERLLALEDASFAAELSRSFEYQLGAVIDVGPRAAIPLRQRHAVRYCQTGVALIGDAAHTIHPLAGQGVNLGLMDAYVLADEIKRACKKGLAISSDSVLGRYERRRMPDNLAMMTVMESFKRFYSAQHPALRWLRNWGMNQVNEMGPLKRHLIQEAMGLRTSIKSN